MSLTSAEAKSAEAQAKICLADAADAEADAAVKRPELNEIQEIDCFLIWKVKKAELNEIQKMVDCSSDLEEREKDS